MDVNLGKLNQRINIYLEEVTKDAQGFKKVNQILFMKTWASVNSISGTEIIKSNTDFEKVKKRFLIRYDEKANKINHDMFILFNNQKYKVIYTNNYNESNEYIEIITEVYEQ